MRIEDLTPYTYTNRKSLEEAIAVGWLEGEDLPKKEGKVPAEVVKILKGHRVQNFCKGFHWCEYCDEGGKTVGTGNGEIWIIYGDKLYIAPYLIIHYIEEHNYEPPQEFIDAVMKGFQPDSPGYEMRLRTILK